jgi:hypothetical protein
LTIGAAGSEAASAAAMDVIVVFCFGWVGREEVDGERGESDGEQREDNEAGLTISESECGTFPLFSYMR